MTTKKKPALKTWEKWAILFPSGALQVIPDDTIQVFVQDQHGDRWEERPVDRAQVQRIIREGVTENRPLKGCKAIQVRIEEL